MKCDERKVAKVTGAALWPVDSVRMGPMRMAVIQGEACLDACFAFHPEYPYLLFENWHRRMLLCGVHTFLFCFS